MNVPGFQVPGDFCPLMSSSPYKHDDDFFPEGSSDGSTLAVAYPVLNYQLNQPVRGENSTKGVLELDDFVRDDVHSCASKFPLVKSENNMDNGDKDYEILALFDPLFPWEHKYCGAGKSVTNAAYSWSTAIIEDTSKLPNLSNSEEEPNSSLYESEKPIFDQLSCQFEDVHSGYSCKDLPTLKKGNGNSFSLEGKCSLDNGKQWIPESTRNSNSFHPLEDFNSWYIGDRGHDRAFSPVEELHNQESCGVTSCGTDIFPSYSKINQTPKDSVKDKEGNVPSYTTWDGENANEFYINSSQSKHTIASNIYEDVSSDEDTGVDNAVYMQFKTPPIIISKPRNNTHLFLCPVTKCKADLSALSFPNSSILSEYSGNSSGEDVENEEVKENCTKGGVNIETSVGKNDDSGIDMNCSHSDKMDSTEKEKRIVHRRIAVPTKRPVVRDFLSDVSTDDDGVETRKKRKRRFCRKPTSPQKSATPRDPKFKGVTFQVKTKLQENESQLAITAYFNCGQSLLYREHYRQSFTPPRGNFVSNEDSDSEGADSVLRDRRGLHYSGKQCASCGTRKTPLWRDAEDGTPLCNACGIRYRKYRIRCGRCWYIPKKDNKMQPFCANCGETLKFSMFRSKNWS